MNLRKLAGGALGALVDPVLLGLVALAMIGSTLFLAHELGKTRVQRDAAREVAKTLTIWADRTCEAVGVAFRPDGEKNAGKWGGACLDAIRSIRAERDAMKEASAQAALDAIAEQQRKTAADALAARKADAARRRARQTMETANARITGDDVGPEWWTALNELGRLLRPSRSADPAETYGDRPAGEGDPASGTDPVP